MSNETRALLLKPGDTLLIGNVGDLDDDVHEHAREFFERIGVSVAIFAGDIDIDKASL